MNKYVLELAARIEALHPFQFNMRLWFITHKKMGEPTRECGCFGGWAMRIFSHTHRGEDIMHGDPYAKFISALRLPPEARDHLTALLHPWEVESKGEHLKWWTDNNYSKDNAVAALRKFAAAYPHID